MLGELLDEFRQGSLLDQLKFQVDSHKTSLARLVLHAAAPWAFNKPIDVESWQGRYAAIDERRAFNDLAMSLAVLRNSGRLGDQNSQIGERVVVAWHLLR